VLLVSAEDRQQQEEDVEDVEDVEEIDAARSGAVRMSLVRRSRWKSSSVSLPKITVCV
jgi:hypothetical protein